MCLCTPLSLNKIRLLYILTPPAHLSINFTQTDELTSVFLPLKIIQYFCHEYQYFLIISNHKTCVITIQKY